MKLLLPILIVASAQAQVLEKFIGQWESVQADGTRFEVTREWLIEGKVLVEEAINENNEEGYLALWGHDPESNRYRIVTLRRDSASHMQGSWDADSATLRLDRITDSARHSRLTVTVAGDSVKFAGATQTRAEFPEPNLIRWRSDGLRVLQFFVGSWNSRVKSAAGEEFANTVHTVWSRKRFGDFLISTEADKKASLQTFDPATQVYRGVSLEAGGATFSRGRWERGLNAMNSHVYGFELPRDAEGKPLPDAKFEDGLVINLRERVYHKFMRQIQMTAHIGSGEIWKGRGQINRDIEQDRVWAATLSSHPGKALINGTKFQVNHGFGENIGLGPGRRHLKLFFDNGAIRKFHRSGLWLNVSMNRFRPGQNVNFWRMHRLNNDPHKWQVNADNTISPKKAPQLVLGWSDGNLRLVRKGDEGSLVFNEVPK